MHYRTIASLGKGGIGDYTFQRHNNKVIIISFGPGILIVKVFYSYECIALKP